MASDLRPRSALHAYQERGARWIVDREAAGLFMDVGLGKTVTALTAIADLLATDAVGKTLVIGPPRVVATVWAHEAAAWAHTRDLRVLTLTGGPEERRERLREGLEDADVVCVSFGLLPWLHRTVSRKRWDLIVIDESSLVRNAKTRRWKACAYAAAAASRRVILTGTPTPKSLADLWGQVSVADLGARFGRSQYGFLRRYFSETDFGWTLRKGAGKQIMGKLKDFAIAMRAKDYLELPDLIENRIDVRLPGKAAAVYQELVETFGAELESGTVVDVANAAVMAGKLAQVAQGAIFREDGSWEALHAEKLDAVEETVSELAGEPVLIAYWYRHDLERLRRRFPEAPVLSGVSGGKLTALIDRWNRGEIPVLLLHPASAGHGLNLQAGGRHLIWMALPWSWELTHQTVARLYRQGQTKPVIVHRIVAEGTIDERILTVIAERQSGHDAVVGALRADVAAHRRVCTKDAGPAHSASVGYPPC